MVEEQRALDSSPFFEIFPQMRSFFAFSAKKSKEQQFAPTTALVLLVCITENDLHGKLEILANDDAHCCLGLPCLVAPNFRIAFHIQMRQSLVHTLFQSVAWSSPLDWPHPQFLVCVLLLMCWCW
jgi:hypothetical protein